MSSLRIRGKRNIIYIRYQACGRTVSKSTGLPDTPGNRRKALLIEAQHKLQTIRRRRFRLNDPVEKRFDEAAIETLERLRQIGVKPKALNIRKGHSREMIAFFKDELLMQIQEQQLRDYVATLNLGGASVFNRMKFLSEIFRQGKSMGWCDHDPVPMIREELPRLRKSTIAKVLTYQQENTYFLAAACNLNLSDLGTLLLHLGARLGEIRRLHRNDVDFGRRIVSIRPVLLPEGLQLTKNDYSIREVPMTKTVEEILRRRLSTSPWVFPSPRLRKPGKLVSLNTIHNWHSKACGKTDFDFRLHDFRHTFTTRMEEDCEVLRITVEALLGHRVPYRHSTEKARRGAMEAYECSLLSNGSVTTLNRECHRPEN